MGKNTIFDKGFSKRTLQKAHSKGESIEIVNEENHPELKYSNTECQTGSANESLHFVSKSRQNKIEYSTREIPPFSRVGMK